MFSELAGLAIHNLMRARSRLFMTAGGVLVGTAAVILLIALTIGLQTAAEAGIGNSNALTEIYVSPNFDPSLENTPQLDIASVQALWNIPNVAAVIPMVMLRGGELNVDGLFGWGQITGVDPQLMPYLGVQVEQGSLEIGLNRVVAGAAVGQYFNDPEADSFEPIAVDLMAQPPTLRLYAVSGDDREIDLQVSGVLTAGSNYDYSILMPIQQVIDLNEWMVGQPTKAEDFRYDQVIVRATNRETTQAVSEAIRELGYGTGGMGDFLSQINNFFGTMRLVLGGVGGVALLVAAFGVANTMTMAILERTREIGLMKAIGATDRDVLTVFLIEAALVGLAGGLAGVGVSLVLQNLINQAIANAPQPEQGGVMFLPIDTSQIGGNLVVIPVELALFALALATFVGIGAGFFPALRAARMTTVTALKTE